MKRADIIKLKFSATVNSESIIDSIRSIWIAVKEGVEVGVWSGTFYYLWDEMYGIELVQITDPILVEVKRWVEGVEG